MTRIKLSHIALRRAATEETWAFSNVTMETTMTLTGVTLNARLKMAGSALAEPLSDETLAKRYVEMESISISSTVTTETRRMVMGKKEVSHKIGAPLDASLRLAGLAQEAVPLPKMHALKLVEME